jgi:hypothetical protein
MDDKMKREDEGEQEVKGKMEKIKQRQFWLIITTISSQVT